MKQKTFKFRISEVTEKYLSSYDNETITEVVRYKLEEKDGLFWVKIYPDWRGGEYFNTIEGAKNQAQIEVNNEIRALKKKKLKEELKTTIKIISNFEITKEI